jgi:large subunit ribosomal protein L31e
MAKAKSLANEREYVIPLRREILKVPRHKRTPKAVKALKQFLAKHMRIPDRDVNKIKLDDYLNKELWHRGIRNPPTKIKVKVKRDGENILVTLSELPKKFKFEQARKDKKAKALEASKKKTKESSKDKKPENKVEGSDSTDSSKEEKAEEKAEEKEKKESSSEAKQKQAKEQAKTQKHTQSAKEKKVQPQRKALQK